MHCTLLYMANSLYAVQPLQCYNQRKQTYYTKNSTSNIKFQEFSRSFPGLRNSRSFPGFPGEWEPWLHCWYKWQDAKDVKVSCPTTAVSMLSNDVAMTVLRSNTQSFADLKTETWRVKHCSTSKHAVNWQTTQLPGHIRHNVNWIPNNTTSLYICE